MSWIERREALRPDEIGEVRALAAKIETEVGAPPLNDQSLARLDQSRAGLAHVTAVRDGALVGYAQLDGSDAEVAALDAVSSALLDAIEQAGPTTLQVWSHGASSPLAGVLQEHGFRRGRVLHQLRRGLAQLPPPAPLAADVTVRPFLVGQDEAAWLAVNAAAFAAHAEQGRWTATDLAAREREAWFDPSGFFLALRADELVGFHWTKVHPDGAGEVYVLGVHPAAQGLRLGAALLDIGLRHLSRRGCLFVLLYVDESNTVAMRLYERAGFVSHDVDMQWTLVR